jgi:hypothetical protein
MTPADAATAMHSYSGHLMQFASGVDTETALFYGPADLVEAHLTEWTLAVHLWATSSLLATPEVAKKRNAPPPSGSWIAGKCAAYGVDTGHRSE